MAKINGFWRWYLGGLLSIIRSIRVTSPIFQATLGVVIVIAGSAVVIAFYLPLPLLIVTILGGITLAAHGVWAYK